MRALICENFERTAIHIILEALSFPSLALIPWGIFSDGVSCVDDKWLPFATTRNYYLNFEWPSMRLIEDAMWQSGNSIHKYKSITVYVYNMQYTSLNQRMTNDPPLTTINKHLSVQRFYSQFIPSYHTIQYNENTIW